MITNTTNTNTDINTSSNINTSTNTSTYTNTKTSTPYTLPLTKSSKLANYEADRSYNSSSTIWTDGNQEYLKLFSFFALPEKA